MCSTRACGSKESLNSQPNDFVIQTLSAARSAALTQSLMTHARNDGLAAAIDGGRSSGIEYHVVSGSDGALASVSVANDLDFSTILTGAIAGIPFQLELSGKLDLASQTISISLTLLKPIKTETYTWTFKLGGLREIGNGAYFASDITLDEASSSDLSALGLDWLCVLKCGGTAIIGILLQCLPSLAGGPPAYIACVTASAGAGAAGIAACIASKCA